LKGKYQYHQMTHDQAGATNRPQGEKRRRNKKEPSGILPALLSPSSLRQSQQHQQPPAESSGNVVLRISQVEIDQSS
jgi:hypothetical protein